jgi:IPT/TIG domain
MLSNATERDSGGIALISRRIALVLTAALLVSLTAPLPAVAQTVVVSCPFQGVGGDLTERGIYVSGYAGTNLDTVTLKYGPSTTGSYSITLTARLGAYNGALIGTSTVTEDFTAQVAEDVLFSFGAAPVPAGSTIAFVQSFTGPGQLFFDVGNGPLGDPTYGGCPGVVETEGTTPPLDEFRRASVGLTITQLDVPAPSITSFTPTAGPIGTSVVIIGTNFSGTGFTTESVTFNGVTAPFTVNSATQITATVPTGATSGLIRVTTPGGTATSSANFGRCCGGAGRSSTTICWSLRRSSAARGVVVAS